MTREEADELLRGYKQEVTLAFWRNITEQLAYEKCTGTAVNREPGTKEWDEMVDSFYEWYLILNSSLYKALKED